jgi:hypothetical protein
MMKVEDTLIPLTTIFLSDIVPVQVPALPEVMRVKVEDTLIPLTTIIVPVQVRVFLEVMNIERLQVQSLRYNHFL